MNEQRNWYIWNQIQTGETYGNVLYKRAIGELPEMQCARAAANQLSTLLRPNDRIADVGCGPGHYLRSLKQRLDFPFHYTGVDGTPEYLEFAHKAFAGTEGCEFKQGDIFNLPFKDNQFDFVMCCNVLLHLPSIEKPIAELMRIAKRGVLIRTMVGSTTFIIREARGDQYEADGSPTSFNFYNIYSENRVHAAVRAAGGVAQIIPDNDFDAEQINADVSAHGEQEKRNVTRVINGLQVREYIIQPYCWIKIQKNANS